MFHLKWGVDSPRRGAAHRRARPPNRLADLKPTCLFEMESGRRGGVHEARSGGEVQRLGVGRIPPEHRPELRPDATNI